MGYFREDRPGHEGYAVGFVTREGCDPGSGLVRELAYPDDDHTCSVALISSGCDCGWRSPRFVPREPASWSPYSVQLEKGDDDRVYALWSEHMRAEELVAPLGAVARVGGDDPPSPVRGRKGAPCGVPWAVCPDCLGEGLRNSGERTWCARCQRTWSGDHFTAACPLPAAVLLVDIDGVQVWVCASHAAHPRSGRLARVTAIR